jgi:hypothetical protein
MFSGKISDEYRGMFTDLLDKVNQSRQITELGVLISQYLLPVV